MKKEEIRVIHLSSVDSTNNYIKEIDVSKVPTVVISDMQTGGRGTVGRSFFSPKGVGLYMTIGFNPEGLSTEQVMTVTRLTGVTLKRVLNRFSLHEAVIKPVNDIYIDGKKVAGILTESKTTGVNRFEAVYVGIGVNCFRTSLPEEIKDIAGYIEYPRFEFTIQDLLSAILDEFISLINEFNIDEIIKEYENGIGKNWANS